MSVPLENLVFSLIETLTHFRIIIRYLSINENTLPARQPFSVQIV